MKNWKPLATFDYEIVPEKGISREITVFLRTDLVQKIQSAPKAKESEEVKGYCEFTFTVPEAEAEPRPPIIRDYRDGKVEIEIHEDLLDLIELARISASTIKRKGDEPGYYRLVEVDHDPAHRVVFALGADGGPPCLPRDQGG